MAEKVFAPNYERDSNGLILFPKDSAYRRSIFKFWDRLGISMSEHPAKANMYLVQELANFVAEPGQTIMDVTSGTGTIMIAALFGKQVVCIEIEDEYVKILEEAQKDIEEYAPGAGDAITIIQGDCARILPLAIADHVVFSPPYSNIMKKKSMDSLTLDNMGDGIINYSKSPNNISNLNEFLYHQKMEQIYKKIYQSLPVGGTLSIIIKDHMEKGHRMMLGERAKRDCLRIGFEEVMHDRWLPPGSVYLAIKRARGETVVDEEDIIILRRPL